MNGTDITQQYELLFQSRRDERHVYAFPCDARGHVDMNKLPSRALNDYLFARALVGHDFWMPSLRKITSDNYCDAAA